jgi:hypothetical protein
MNSRMRHRKARYFFLLFFLLSLFTIGFHHHDDGLDHLDCPICMASGPFSREGSQDGASLTIHEDIVYLSWFKKEVINLPSSIFPTIAYRAPPFSSLV